VTEDYKSPLPNATEIEASVLAACIINPAEAVTDVIDEISERDFYLGKHKAVWKAIQKLAFFKNPIDLTTIAQTLMDAGQLADAGGVGYLSDLVNKVPASTDVSYHIQTIKEKRALRESIEMCNAVQKRCFGNEPAVETIETMHRMALDIEIDSGSDDLKTMQDLILEQTDFMQMMIETGRGMIGCRTGYPGVDIILNGHQKGDLIILAARPGMGKTALAINMAKFQASSGIKVGIFSVEMPARQLLDRMIADVAEVDSTRFYGGKFSQEEMNIITEAQGKIWELPLWVDDKGGIKIEELRARAKKYKKLKGLRVLYIDYLQLLFSNQRFDSRNNELGYITSGLKALAKELDITIVCLSQLNRECEKRPNPGKRPKLSDLRDSGNIEQDADIVQFIYRGSEYDDDTIKSDNHTELNTAKNRKGRCGITDLKWEAQYTRFRELTVHYDSNDSPLGQ
jgi:replicative DNA helicase